MKRRDLLKTLLGLPLIGSVIKDKLFSDAIKVSEPVGLLSQLPTPMPIVDYGPGVGRTSFGFFIADFTDMRELPPSVYEWNGKPAAGIELDYSKQNKQHNND